jgi:hypothetical protein
MEIDLEQEFQILMRAVVKQIDDKEQRGELTTDEAVRLSDMIRERMQPPERKPARAWNSSGCYDVLNTDYTWDDGWSPSTC